MSVRTMVNLADDLKAWVEQQSNEFGMSQSAFINLCVATYRQNQDALKAMQNVSGLVEQLSSMKDAMIEIQSNENNKVLGVKK